MSQEEDTDSTIVTQNKCKRKRFTQEDFDFLTGWEKSFETQEEYSEVTKHPWIQNCFRIRCQFFERSAYKVCVYSKCNEKGEVQSSSQSNHRYLHCCCRNDKGECCRYEKRLDHIEDSIDHPKCPGKISEKRQQESSSLSVIGAIAELSRKYGVPDEVCASQEMENIVMKSMQLQNSFQEEKPHVLLPKISPIIIKNTRVEAAHFQCRSRLQCYQDQVVSLILDGGLMAIFHVVAVLLISPYIDQKSLLLALCTGAVTADSIARLVASITKNLSVLRIRIGGTTTDGAPALASGLSLFSDIEVQLEDQLPQIEPWTLTNDDQEDSTDSEDYPSSSKMIKDNDSYNEELLQKDQLNNIMKTPDPIQRISGSTGLASPTATFLGSKPELQTPRAPVVVQEILTVDDQHLAMNFQQEAYEFFAG
ncbi:MAG: hypothetical protein EZS28_024898, partial [Streblomastix strix]